LGASLVVLMLGAELAGALVTIIAVALVGPAIEWTQWLTAGRGYENGDWIAHEIGVAAGLVTLVVLWFGRDRVARGLQVKEVAVPEETDLEAAAVEQEEAKQQGKSVSFVGDARTVSLLTLLSRVTGLVRDRVNSVNFGQAGVADALAYGFQVPNLF